MEIIAALAALFGTGRLLSGAWYSTQEVGDYLSFWSGVLLVIGVAVLPLYHAGTHSGIAQYRAVAATIDTARVSGYTVESAALQLEVVKANKWRASMRYWNQTVFDWWIPDEINQLEVIQ